MEKKEERFDEDFVMPREKKIYWTIPGDIKTGHATHIIMQRFGVEIIVFFFEVQTPVLSGTPEQQKDDFDKIESIEARCVGKLVISQENALMFVNSIQANALGGKTNEFQ